jgi:hypothetical protein
MKLNEASDEDTMTQINDIDTRMVQWSIDTRANESRWQYFARVAPDPGPLIGYSCAATRRRFYLTCWL